MARYGTCEHSAQSAAEARLPAAAAQQRTAAEEVRGEVGTICRSGEEDVPMRRYTNTNLSALGTDSYLYRQAREQTVLLEQLLEQTSRQNQTLLELLGAANSLTAALLAWQRRQGAGAANS